MQMLKECYTLTQEQVDAIPLVEALEESVRELKLRKAGGAVKNSAVDLKGFFKDNKNLVGDAAVLALSSFNEYRKHRRDTIKLHAKSAYDKKMMTSIVDALKNSGKFKVQRIKFEKGGKSWILKTK